MKQNIQRRRQIILWAAMDMKNASTLGFGNRLRKRQLSLPKDVMMLDIPDSGMERIAGQMH
jgi:hypothetical protein